MNQLIPALTPFLPNLKLNPLNKFFTPPLFGNPGAPDAYVNFIVLAILLMLPELLTILRDAFRSKPLPYSAAVGAGVAAGAGLIGGIAGGGIRAGIAYKVRTPQVGEAGGWRGVLRQVTRT